MRKASFEIGTVVATWLVLLTVLPSYSQNGGLEPFDPDRFRQRVHHALNLTYEQKLNLKALRAELTEELWGLEQDINAGLLNPKDGRSHYRQMMRAHKAERDLILTDKQLNLLHKGIEFSERQKTVDPAQVQNPQNSEIRLVETLELSDEQTTLWYQLLQWQREQILVLKGERILVSREDVRRLRNQHREAFEALLTNDQLAELEKIREEWHRSDETETIIYDEPDPDDLPTAGDEESWSELQIGDDNAETD